jgi:hypothetical protein
MKYTTLIATGLLLCTQAHAFSSHKGGSVRKDGRIVEEPTKVQAPEIDAGSAIAALTLLAGAIAVLSGRRNRLER